MSLLPRATLHSDSEQYLKSACFFTDYPFKGSGECSDGASPVTMTPTMHALPVSWSQAKLALPVSITPAKL